MNENLPPELQRYLHELDPDKQNQLQLQARLATGISHPNTLSPEDRALLERIRQDDPRMFEELEMIGEFSTQSPVARPHCSRFVPFAHALVGFLVAGIVLWLLGADRRWVCYLAALPTLYGLWNLKSALFDSQAKLDRDLYG